MTDGYKTFIKYLPLHGLFYTSTMHACTITLAILESQYGGRDLEGKVAIVHHMSQYFRSLKFFEGRKLQPLLTCSSA